MKKKKSLKLGTKLIIKSVSILSAFLIAAFAIVIFETAQTSTQSALDSITSLAQRDAATIVAELTEPLDTVRAIANSMQGYKNIDIAKRRNFYSSIIKGVLENNESYVGVWTCWEPDALDGLDSVYSHNSMSDSTGRFIPFWQRTNGKVFLTALVDYETEGAGDYYLLAKKTGQETILDPYTYKLGGKDVLLTTVSVPIKDETGTVVGVAGINLALSDLQNTAFVNGGFESVHTSVISNTGTYIISPNSELIGTTIADSGDADAEAILAAISRGETFQRDGISQQTGEPIKSVYCPVIIGNSTAPWSVVVEVDNAEVMASTMRMSTTLIIILAVLLAVIVVSLLLMVRYSISKPIKETANLAKSLAEGHLDAPVKIKSYDEIGELKAILDDQVRGAFKNIQKTQVVTEKQSRYSSEQVDKLVVNLERLSKGELYCDMSVGDADEDTQDVYTLFSNISANLHMSVNAIKGYIKDISSVLGEISAKNLNVEISAEYQGDFVALKDSINGIVQSLNEVMLDINVSADQVASGTQQVSGGSQEISQGATEQASAIEELTASVSQIAEQTRLNAASANEASQLTTSAKRDAEQGNEQMKAMQQAMADINEASASIGKIIKVIDDIAFQTNILALNAAVEAARAGAHGKGFAVVAEEVRNLAARSANAAKETTDLIEGSIRKAEAGTRIASETAGSLANIVRGVEKAAQLVGEIAQASNEQASAIMQVNRGIEQMSLVVQTNSATSEEAAAAAEELSSQAEMLKNMIGQFSLKSDDSAKAIEAAGIGEAEPQTQLNDSDFGKY